MRLLLFSILLLLPSVASAHELTRDAAVGAVLHIDPSDDPVIGEQSVLYWDITDTTGTFSLEECTCLVHIERAGKEVYSGPVDGTGRTASVAFVFSAAGTYTIHLEGKPIARQEFTDFSLTSTVRVSRERLVIPTSSAGTTTSNNYLYPVLGVSGAVGALVMLKIAKQKRRKSHKENRTKE